MSADAVLTLLQRLIADVAALRADLGAMPTRRLRLEDCGDVVTLAELGRLLGYGPRYCERLVTLERRTGVRVLPPPVAGARGRFLRRDVETWLRRGGLTRRVDKQAGRGASTSRP